jgi:uncharacterized protein (TIGR02246 family)
MASGLALQDIHAAVERTVNDGDVEGFAALYTADACLVGPDGATVVGPEAIRGAMTPLFALRGRMTVTTRHVVEVGDLALLSSEWSYTAGDVRLSGIASEVVQRQPDGGWLYVIDHPYAAPAPGAAAPEAQAPATAET